jgi:hypothetical protein
LELVLCTKKAPLGAFLCAHVSPYLAVASFIAAAVFIAAQTALVAAADYNDYKHDNPNATATMTGSVEKHIVHLLFRKYFQM